MRCKHQACSLAVFYSVSFPILRAPSFQSCVLVGLIQLVRSTYCMFCTLLSHPGPTVLFSLEMYFDGLTPVLFFYSSTLQSTQWMIKAEYNQRSWQSTPLLTAWINHQIWGQYMCGAPERLSAFGGRTFPSVITTSVVQGLNEKIAGVDCMIRWLSILLHV
jgi:hypothetical protein